MRALLSVACITLLAFIGPSFASGKAVNVFCEVTRNSHYPELQWVRLESGVVLKTYDAILTCASSTVSLKSNFTFGQSIIKWERADGDYVGEMPPETLLVVQTESRSTEQPNIQVKVTEVAGDVFYSTKRDLIKDLRVLHSFATSEEKTRQAQRERDFDLKAIGWEPLGVDRLLGPWDMIWTQKNGRVEIEIRKTGRDLMTDESTDVRDAHGKLTLTKRFPQDSYFIMLPQFYQEARVNKTIGEVWVATDRAKVREFFNKHHSGMSIKAEVDPEAQRKLQEILRKKELE